MRSRFPNSASRTSPEKFSKVEMLQLFKDLAALRPNVTVSIIFESRLPGEAQRTRRALEESNENTRCGQQPDGWAFPSPFVNVEASFG